MIKHTIEIAQRPARIKLENRQLVIISGENAPRRFACEDIGVLILQHPAISLSAAILNALLAEGAAIIICDSRHLPSGLLLPTVTHTELVPRMMSQLDATVPRKKLAWKLIVKAKILAQAKQLSGLQQRRLQTLAENVKSGDSANHEAQAAKIYWAARFPKIYGDGDQRDPDGLSLFNTLLNYGYAIVRATIARALVSAGLLPALGVFHHRRGNPYCLADDLIEPLRPLVDQKVAEILDKQEYLETTDLTSELRQELLSLITAQLEFKEQSGPLMAILPRYISSFFGVISGEAQTMHFPRF